MTTKNIAIFASGSGTNALNICNYFKDNSSINITTLVCNKPNAKVVERLQPFKIEVILIKKADLHQPKKLIKTLQNGKIDLIILAGFLWLIPIDLVKAYRKKIINLHPALLPKYGGKGMYGLNVHKAVLSAKEIETGITIHYVNELYDEGATIFQVTTKIDKDETPASLAQKIHQLEYTYFPKVVEEVLSKQKP